MKKNARALLFLGDSPMLRERVRRAAEGAFTLIVVQNWAELEAAVREVGFACVAVADPYHGQGRDGPPAAELRRLLRQHRALTLFAIIQRRPGWLDHVRLFGEWGVADLIEVETHDTATAVRRRILAVRGRPLRRLIGSGDLGRLSPHGRAILEAAVEVVAVGGGAPELVRELNAASEDTLLRWCHGAGLPVPRRLLIWIRALIAAELLDTPGWTLWDAARASGYASDDTLRRALRTVSGATPTELRERGAWAVLSQAFVRTLKNRGPLHDSDAT